MYAYLESLRKSYIKNLGKLAKGSEEFIQKDIKDIENQFPLSRKMRIEHRIMWAFRNFMTHAPYADVRSNFEILFEREKPNEKDSPRRSRITSNPTIVIDIVAKDWKFKQECGDDIKQMKHEGCNCFDVKFMLRGYIEEVAKIHNIFREKTDSLLNNILNELHTIGREMLPESEIPPIIRMVKLDSEDNNREEFTLGYEHQSRLRDKRQEWQNFDREKKHYYSSEIILSKEKYPQEDPDTWITE